MRSNKSIDTDVLLDGFAGPLSAVMSDVTPQDRLSRMV